MADDTRDRTGPLSPRQREVLALIAKGLTRPQIAEQMRLNRVVVTRMVSGSILPKLQLARTAQAVALWGKAEGLREAADWLEANDLYTGAQCLRDRADGLLP